MIKTIEIDGYKYEYKGEKSIIEALLSLQWQKYTYDEFILVLKRRLKLYTGKEEVLFYNDEQLAKILIELGEVKLY